MFRKSVNNFLDLFGIQLKSKKALLIERAYLDSKYNGAVEIYNVLKKYQHLKLNDELEGMVFSKNRAMQLQALLNSYIKNVANYCPLIILYKATNERSKKAYEDLKREFKTYSIIFLEEKNFYSQVNNWLSTAQSDRIFFMTDDAVFLDSFDLKLALFFNPLDTILSLTKGYDLIYCFTHDTMQELPHFTKKTILNGNSFNFWKWNSIPGSPDWSYPISVDGNFFLREEMLKMVNNISFNNPNSFEASLQVFCKLFDKREGVCFDKVKLINVPCNVVQKEFKNRSTCLFSVEELQNLWDKGQRINIDDFNKIDAVDAVHKKYTFINDKLNNDI